MGVWTTISGGIYGARDIPMGIPMGIVCPLMNNVPMGIVCPLMNNVPMGIPMRPMINSSTVGRGKL